jgi:serine O-acetyltransferase
MKHEEITKALLASYEAHGGINHLDGVNLPAQEAVNELARECMQLLFPGYFERSGLPKGEVPAFVGRALESLENRLEDAATKSLRYARHPDPVARGREIASYVLMQLPELRKMIQTDVTAAYEGDPAARSVEEIVLAYPCVLAISLQRVAHVLYHLGLPLLPRMLTEYAHERTGIDIHPGARLGTHFFIDHGTGVVIGETATIGSRVKLYQGVTLGARSFETDASGNPVKGVKRHPDVEDHVTIYAHATILGGDTRIGAHSVIGANVSIVGQSIPSHSVAYNKGDSLVIRRRKKQEALIGQAGPVGDGDWNI